MGNDNSGKVLHMGTTMGGTGKTLAEFYATEHAAGLVSPATPPGAKLFTKISPTPFKFDLIAGEQPANRLVFGPTGKGMTLNPVTDIAANTDWCLRFIQLAALYELDDARYAAARRIALDVADKGEPSVRSLVDAWRNDATLNDFADAVAKAMLPA